ncbi:hypothetical protein DICVIV_13806 [Dictyocaulus viviparus]|uniref:Uncharacterized protein n=1 Tax=Dictyocaulus viviparus TaxID=29172 RepID=A0A0D8X6X5_DICVI|nr:hypothetical protein DICVIV_13806 [Dictyocaulus viviparus]
MHLYSTWNPEKRPAAAPSDFYDKFSLISMDSNAIAPGHTTNIIMANWQRSMWQDVMNRALRSLSSGPFSSNFIRASIKLWLTLYLYIAFIEAMFFNNEFLVLRKTDKIVVRLRSQPFWSGNTDNPVLSNMQNKEENCYIIGDTVTNLCLMMAGGGCMTGDVPQKFKNLVGTLTVMLLGFY